MTTVAVIAEFNPPHNGHAHLVREIRKRFGSDTAVIAIMSGNYVQRGDVAVTNKYFRAKMALDIGVNLVLELPFPFSIASADYYATAGVRIADALGCVDYLCFGSECGNIETLSRIADYLSSDTCATALCELRKNRAYASKSHAELTTMLVRRECGDLYAEAYRKPNNILAVAYITAIKRNNASLAAYTFPRVGNYHSAALTDNTFASASAIRKQLLEGDVVFLQNALPPTVFSALQQVTSDGACPSDIHRLSTSVLLKLHEKCLRDIPIADTDASLRSRIYTSVQHASNYQELITLVKARHYTDAHVQRALLFTYFGITSSEICQAPLYTNLLASDSVGNDRLKIIKKRGSIPVVTKPADYSVVLKDAALCSAEIGIFADTVYMQTLPKPQPGADIFRFTPYIRK